jgi:hypothetical protein
MLTQKQEGGKELVISTVRRMMAWDKDTPQEALIALRDAEKRGVLPEGKGEEILINAVSEEMQSWERMGRNDATPEMILMNIDHRFGKDTELREIALVVYEERIQQDIKASERELARARETLEAFRSAKDGGK